MLKHPAFATQAPWLAMRALSFASSHHPHAIPQTCCGTLRNGRYFVDGAPGQLTVLHHDPSSDYAVTDASVFPYHDIAKGPLRQRFRLASKSFSDERMTGRQAAIRAAIAVQFGESKQRILFLRHVAVPAVAAQRHLACVLQAACITDAVGFV